MVASASGAGGDRRTPEAVPRHGNFRHPGHRPAAAGGEAVHPERLPVSADRICLPVQRRRGNSDSAKRLPGGISAPCRTPRALYLSSARPGDRQPVVSLGLSVSGKPGQPSGALRRGTRRHWPTRWWSGASPPPWPATPTLPGYGRLGWRMYAISSRQEFSTRCARALLLDNPRKILKDEPITLAEPEWF